MGDMDFKLSIPKIKDFTILWNNDEIKEALAAKLKDFQGLAYTEDSVKEAKADKAELNKLRTSIEDKRKEIKSACMKPYQTFEKEVKELVAMIDEPLAEINGFLSEAEERRVQEKQALIEKIFAEIGFPDFVQLEQLADKKWTNATYKDSKIREALTAVKMRISTDIPVIEGFGEYAFEAMEEYKATLDLGAAMRKTQELTQMAKMKAEAASHISDKPKDKQAEKEPARAHDRTGVVHRISLRVEGTAEQLGALGEYLEKSGLKYTME